MAGSRSVVARHHIESGNKSPRLCHDPMPAIGNLRDGMINKPSDASMSEVSTETKPTTGFDSDTFAMNLANAMQNGGRALAALI